MAEFVQTMKEWQRMCDTFKACDDCPIQKEDGWTYVLCSEGGMSSVKPEVVEKVIEKWSAENPEPIYPTWAEYLETLELYSKSVSDSVMIDKLENTHIPADIAQKLDIAPKEG